MKLLYNYVCTYDLVTMVFVNCNVTLAGFLLCVIFC